MSVALVSLGASRGGKEIEREIEGGERRSEARAGIKVRVKAVGPRRTGETKGRGLHLKSTIEIQDPYAKSLARTGGAGESRRTVRWGGGE